ncbi:MAG: hypothetical protein M3Z04_18995 [Chloroflexota bacterium]|nr:hypothetical protein [Chloroflexota bacterium]
MILPIETPSGFPTTRLSALVKVEGRGPEISRPPLYLHKWWARRFGSVFRSILLGVLLQDGDDVWTARYKKHDFSDTVILDPFMGGGTTLLEAARLGAKVVGCDVNPVAWWTTRTALQQPRSWSALESAFRELEREAVRLFSSYYATICPMCNAHATIWHTRWVYVLPCAHCDTPNEVFKSHILGKHGATHWIHCPHCALVFRTATSPQTPSACPNCQTVFDPGAGNSAGGYFTCGSCRQPTSFRKALAQTTDPQQQTRMFAILYHCPQHGSGLMRPTPLDLANYRRAQETFTTLEASLTLPMGRISSEGRSDPRPVNYGYKYWQQLFTPRQLLVLGWLAQRVKTLPPSDMKDTLATVVSQLTNYTNIFCVPRPNRPAAISWIFRLHAFTPPSDFIESNPLAGKTASGTLQNLFWRSVQNAYAYRSNPAERRIDALAPNRSTTVPIPGEAIKPRFISSWEELEQTPYSALLLCRSSEQLPLPDASVHYVITDPPYYDNVTYSELAEFNYVWLHAMLGADYPELAVPLLDHAKELIVSKRIGKGDDFYAEGLCRVFRECCRVLRDDGAMVFTFHHRAGKAWEMLLVALVGAKFRVSAVHTVRSESDRSLHIMDSDSIEQDVVLVCRKTRPTPLIDWNQLLQQMTQEAQQVVAAHDRAVSSSPANVATLVFAQCLKVYSEHYPHITGPDVSVAAAMCAADQITQLLKQSVPATNGSNSDPTLYQMRMEL